MRGLGGTAELPQGRLEAGWGVKKNCIWRKNEKEAKKIAKKKRKQQQKHL